MVSSGDADEAFKAKPPWAESATSEISSEGRVSAQSAGLVAGSFTVSDGGRTRGRGRCRAPVVECVTKRWSGCWSARVGGVVVVKSKVVEGNDELVVGVSVEACGKSCSSSGVGGNLVGVVVYFVVR